jgi:hypothetical protein
LFLICVFLLLLFALFQPMRFQLICPERQQSATPITDNKMQSSGRSGANAVRPLARGIRKAIVGDAPELTASIVSQALAIYAACGLFAPTAAIVLASGTRSCSSPMNLPISVFKGTMPVMLPPDG